MENVKQETIKMEETRKLPSRLEAPGGAKHGAAQGPRSAKLLELL